MTERQRLSRRRGELMVELFLDDLRPAFAVQATGAVEMGYDYLLGIANAHGGVNLCGVQFKVTERPVPEHYRLTAPGTRGLLAHSNVPILFLLADTRRTELHYAWSTDVKRDPDGHGHAEVALRKVTDEAKRTIRSRLATASPEVAAVA